MVAFWLCLINCCCIFFAAGGLDSEAKKALQHELYMSLKVRKESIEDKLRGRLEKLKEICMQEAVSAIAVEETC